MIDENALLGFARRARHRSESTVSRPQRGQITLDVKVKHVIYGDPRGVKSHYP
jgi:hypothetical protein